MLRITLDVCWYALNGCLSGKMRLSPGSLSRRLFPVCSGDHCHPFHHLWVAMDYGFLVLYMTETNKERIFFFRETSISLRAIGRGCSSRARQCGQNSARTCRWRQTTWYLLFGKRRYICPSPVSAGCPGRLDGRLGQHTKGGRRILWLHPTDRNAI